MMLHKDVESVLLSQEKLEKIVKSLAKQIEKDYNDKEFMMVGLLKGSFAFMADLMKRVNLDFSIDFMVASSYGSGTSTTGSVKILKDAGYNAIRSSHNPVVESFLEACDELGLLVMDEYVDCWYIKKTKYDYSQHVEKNYPEDLKRMIDKDFSHPSVALYSIGNEVSETAEKKGIELTKKMVDVLHSLDPSRPVTCGINVAFNGLVGTPMSTYSEGKADKEAEKEEKEAEKRKKSKSQKKI